MSVPTKLLAFAVAVAAAFGAGAAVGAAVGPPGGDEPVPSHTGPGGHAIGVHGDIPGRS